VSATAINFGDVRIDTTGAFVQGNGTNGFGVKAQVGRRCIIVFTDNITDNLAGSSGISAISSGSLGFFGDIAVATGVVQGNQSGVIATTGGTAKVIVVTAGNVTGTNAVGINATAGSGGAQVQTGGTVTGGTSGVLASATGAGTVIVDTRNGLVTGHGSSAFGIGTTSANWRYHDRNRVGYGG